MVHFYRHEAGIEEEEEGTREGEGKLLHISNEQRSPTLSIDRPFLKIRSPSNKAGEWTQAPLTSHRHRRDAEQLSGAGARERRGRSQERC